VNKEQSMARVQYRRPAILVLEPGESLEVRFAPRNGEIPPPMTIHWEDAFRMDRIDRDLGMTRTTSLADELLAARRRD
jgi:hypothetical protein